MNCQDHEIKLTGNPGSRKLTYRESGIRKCNLLAIREYAIMKCNLPEIRYRANVTYRDCCTRDICHKCREDQRNTKNRRVCGLQRCWQTRTPSTKNGIGENKMMEKTK